MLTWFTFLAYAASGSLMAANAFYHGSLASSFWAGLLFASQSLILDAWVASLAWLLARSVKNGQRWMSLLWSVLFLVLGAHSTYTLAHSTDAELRRARHEQPTAANAMNQPLVANAPLPPGAGPRVSRATPQGSPNQKSHLTTPTPPPRNSAQEARHPSPYAVLQASLLTLVVGLGYGVCGYFERSSGRPQSMGSGGQARPFGKAERNMAGGSEAHLTAIDGPVRNPARRTNPQASVSPTSVNQQARAKQSRPSGEARSAQTGETISAPSVSLNTSQASLPSRRGLYLGLFVAAVVVTLLLLMDMKQPLSFQPARGGGVLACSLSQSTWRIRLYRTPARDLCPVPAAGIPTISSGEQIRPRRVVVPP